MKDNFNHHAWIRNQHLKENQDNIQSPSEWIQENMPDIDAYQDNYSWGHLSTAMEGYAEYVLKCKEQ